MEFSRQEYWSGLSFPSPEDLPNPGIEPRSPALQADALLSRRRQWHPTPVLLPGKSHGRRSLVGCSPWGREESDTTERFHFHFSLSCIGEGNGNPLQCSCLENPRDRGAWWAIVYGIAQSRTRLKLLSGGGGGSGFTIWTTREALTSSLEVNKGWNWLDFWNTSHPVYSPHPSPNNWVRRGEESGPALGGWAEMGSLNRGAGSEPFPG